MWFNKFVCLIFIIISFFSFTAFADEINSVSEKELPMKKGTITFNTIGNIHAIDWRCQPIGVVSITESQKGVWEDDKAIYLVLDKEENICVENNIDIEILKGTDIEVSSQVNGNVVKLKLKREKTTSTIPAQIQVQITGYIQKKLEKEQTELSCAIELITGNEYEDNLFYENETKSIVLNDSFIKLVNFIGSKQKFILPSISIKAGENAITVDKQKISVNLPSYIDENGSMMISVNSLGEVLKNDVAIKWDKEVKMLTISFGERVILIDINNNQQIMMINGVSVALLIPIQTKGDEIFLSVRDFAYALGVPDSKIVWDQKSSTVMLNP